MSVGQKIRELRKMKGLTQEAVASALEVSRQAVAKWESDQSYPSTENLLKLKDLFEVSLEEMIDLKQTQTSVLEEYACQKLEKERDHEEKKKIMVRKAKEILLILIAYIAIYCVCYIIFYLAGTKNYIWSWMNRYHVLLISSLLSALLFLLKKKYMSLALLIGTVVSIFVSNFSGGVSVKNSVIGFNVGRIYYLVSICVATMIGYILECGILSPVKKGSQLKDKWNRRLGLIIVLICVFVSIFTVRTLRYKTAAEYGYQQGYQAGSADAKNNRMKDSRLKEQYFPEEYTFGSKAFKGYAIYWPEGYDAGYTDERE